MRSKYTLVCAHCGKTFACAARKQRCCSMACRDLLRGHLPPERIWAKVDRDTTPECWCYTGTIMSTGYGAVRVSGKMYHAHRLAYELTHGPIPTGMHVCHSCDNPACINPDHLWLGTHQDNMRDKVAKGRSGQAARLAHMVPQRGERNPLAKLTDDAVREIRRLHAAGARQNALARRYGVDPSAVGLVVRGKTWRHVT